ncbi:uncharacterized protein B0H18DRAFT_1084582 [Fomitopsis serialis]|uniref:uncharacterized protein n=1 Tax=Fomitopsis serialis TaxID=139415 RepID=UPI0020087122|nr:uncharacterized protein B0H18DRAFT_1084582 [Neoantrodia serialis]KAH9928108.1 hypothetical protein B0H18DRAFT_1084582 [Neoantrodia serialis]
MALPITIPASPAAGSPASTDGTNGPQTPSSPSNPPTLALPPADAAAPAAAPATNNGAANNNATANANKRKPSRRANTAERRATHNAVERARRETLNSRFLDLAALLPNLSQIRRPSKSSIVNSSIAHLRLIKLEADALRRELNEWRDRSGLPRVEEPVRGEGFQMILSGEEDGADYAGDDYGDDEFVGAQNGSVVGNHANIGPVTSPWTRFASRWHTRPHCAPQERPFAHGVPNNGMHLPPLMTRGGHNNGTPMIVQSPTSVSFENPAMVSMYEPHHVLPGMNNEDKVSWHGSMYNGMANPGPGQQQFTPPATAQGQQQRAYFMNMQRQQAMMQQQQRGSMGHAYGSPTDGDDASSVGSGPARRERSGSMGSNGSGYGSPGSSGGYEVPRRMGSGNGAPFGGEGMPMGMNGMGMGPGMMKGAPISVGGGGNGHGYASMML